MMIKKCAIFLIWLPLIGGTVRAHSPAETHATLSRSHDIIRLRIEVPWSIAEAVKAANPELGRNPVEAEFWPYLVDYIHQHVRVFDAGIELPPLAIRDSSGGHTHSARLILEYPARDLKALSVQNSLMFNLYTQQQNQLSVEWEDGSVSYFTTHPQQAIIHLHQPISIRNILLPIGLVITSILGIMCLWDPLQKSVRSKRTKPGITA